MKYLKELLKVFFWPVIFITGQFFIKYLFVIMYNNSKISYYQTLFPNFSDIEIINSIKYESGLNDYLNSNIFLITIVTFVFFGIIFVLKNKDNNFSKKLNINIVIIIILLGIFISIFYNTLVYIINGVIHVTNNFNKNNVDIYILILSTGILGPILEELLFRGIVYNKLLKFNNHKNAVIITSVIFSIMHFPNIINMFYTFLLSFLLLYLTDKYKLFSSIILHVTINTTIVLFINFLILNNIFINTLILLFSIFSLVFLLKKLFSINRSV